MKRFSIRPLLAAAAAAVCAAALCSCGSQKELWDYGVEPDSLELLPSEAVRFTGDEWTGKTFSRDADGNLAHQSSIVRVGSLKHHTVGTVVYDSVENAAEGARNYDRSLSPYYKLLTGGDNVWQLAVYKNVEDAEAAGVLDGFYRTDYDLGSAPVYEGEEKIYSSSNAYYGGFKDVTLPASWQTQGFDFPIYTNTVYLGLTAPTATKSSTRRRRRQPPTRSDFTDMNSTSIRNGFPRAGVYISPSAEWNRPIMSM